MDKKGQNGKPPCLTPPRLPFLEFKLEVLLAAKVPLEASRLPPKGSSRSSDCSLLQCYFVCTSNWTPCSMYGLHENLGLHRIAPLAKKPRQATER
eukprot:6226572-Amphidinium_carterae.1